MGFNSCLTPVEDQRQELENKSIGHTQPKIKTDRKTKKICVRGWRRRGE